MKKFAHIFMFGLAVILLTASCESNTNTETAEFSIDNPTQVRAGALVEATKANTMEMNFNGQTISISTDDIIATVQNYDAENQDAVDVANIHQNLMGAEKEAQLLDVKFVMSDEPVNNGMFIFGMEAESAKELTIEMYDEEGFALVANNKFQINEGNNFKALNVSSLEDGTYNFRLKDDAGRELNREVEVLSEK